MGGDGAGWFEQHLAQMVWRGNVGTARVLLAHANIDLDSLRVELRGPQHMESIHCVESTVVLGGPTLDW